MLRPAISPSRAVVALALLAAASRVTVAQPGKAPLEPLTLEVLFDPEERVALGGSPATEPLWLEDGTAYLAVVEDGDGKAVRLDRVEAASGRARPFLAADRIAAAFAKLPGFDEAGAANLATSIVAGVIGTERAPGRSGRFRFAPDRASLLVNHADDLFVVDLSGRTPVARRITQGPGEEVGEEFSPDGRSVSFVRGGDLHVVDIATGRERALTSGGSDELLNGRLDWVYQEELYGRGNFKGYWWSPDSRHIAFLRLDESPVREFTVVDHLPVELELETTNYPKAGSPNPGVRVGVLPVAGGPAAWIDTSAYDALEHLVVRVSWAPDSSRIHVQLQDREQTWLDLLAAKPGGGKPERLFRETTGAWVEVIGEPVWLPDGGFLWQSERSGYRHLYRYAADGTLEGPVTSGDWEVRGVAGVSPDGRHLFITSSEASPREVQLYRVDLETGARTRVSQRPGSHAPRFNEPMTHYFDRWSDVRTPPRLTLHRADGGLVRTIDANEVPELARYRFGEIRNETIAARDGFAMEAMLILPPGFDPAKKYPVLQYNYGGPHAPVVRDRWGGTRYLWHQMLADRGYVIFMCDNRSASGKGVAPAWEAYGRLGEVELRDMEDAVAWLRARAWVDPDRIGLWGWSYGGYMAAYAMTRSEAYSMAIAGAPVTDWHLYDTIYTERYMKRPQNNPEGYAASSVLEAAEGLAGPLLVIHGTTDDNVHFQNTVRLAWALQRAGKPFELMIYPRSRHRVRDPMLRLHMFRLMTDFVKRNL